jgi:hypothetical protein
MRLSSILRGAPRKSDVSDLRTLNLPISETSEIGGAHLRMRGDVHFVMPALLSSLPDLIRQSMRKRRISSVRFHIRRFSMDHRVKPGGEDIRSVIAGLDPAIHADMQHVFRWVLIFDDSAWTTGSSPVVTR